MIEWPQIAYGAVLSALAAAAVLTLVARPRRLSVIGIGAAAAALGALAWNAILLAVDGRQFFVDAPIAVFPVSWQDTGSGVFALAAASMLLGFGPLRCPAVQTLCRICSRRCVGRPRRRRLPLLMK